MMVMYNLEQQNGRNKNVDTCKYFTNISSSKFTHIIIESIWKTNRDTSLFFLKMGDRHTNYIILQE